MLGDDSAQQLIEPMMTSTTFDIPRYKTVENLGVVRGITVRTFNICVMIPALLCAGCIGGKSAMFVYLCEKSRKEAFAELLSEAKKMGANAVVGIKYESNDLGGGLSEVRPESFLLLDDI